MSGNVILLNGCSSAGKTTLALELQRLSEIPYQYIALDQFRDGLPPCLRGLNSPPGSPGSLGLNVIPERKDGMNKTYIHFGEVGKNVLRTMRRTVADLAAWGCSVVVDDILLEREFLIDYARVLDTSKTWLVAVRCDIDIVRTRESTRPGRFPGTADSHYDSIHEHGIPYDIEVNTSHNNPSELALEVLNGLKTTPIGLANCVTD
jgi:chloramphenicol 3-O phosphotransferase